MCEKEEKLSKQFAILSGHLAAADLRLSVLPSSWHIGIGMTHGKSVRFLIRLYSFKFRYIYFQRPLIFLKALPRSLAVSGSFASSHLGAVESFVKIKE